MNNGLTMSKADFTKWLGEQWQHGIWYRIDNNPTAVYELIKQNYGTDFPNFTRGAEKSVESKKMMMEFLEEKAQANPKGPESFSVFIYAAIPHNLDADNWTNKIV